MRNKSQAKNVISEYLVDLGSRIKAVLDHAGLTQKAFGARLSVGQGTISRYATGHMVVPPEILSELVNLDDRLNARWLLTGIGPMLHNEYREGSLADQVAKLESVVSRGENKGTP